MQNQSLFQSRICQVNLFLSVLLVLASATMSRAQFTFVTNADNTVSLTGYTGSNGDVAIPTELQVTIPVTTPTGGIIYMNTNLPVTSIAPNGYENCPILTNVWIGPNVTSIGSLAFCGCLNLTSVTLPDSITNVASYAFSDCPNLTDINLPDSITSIDLGAFSYCGFTNVSIPKNINSIVDFAFVG